MTRWACAVRGGGGGGWNGVQVSVAIAVKYHGPSLKVLDEKPKASNSTKQ